MKCQKCGKNLATTHIRRSINGQTEEYMLCAECAAKMGYGNLTAGGLFSSLFGLPSPFITTASDTQRCDVCGATYHEIADSGLVGCSHCYEVFHDRLMPSIERIHGRSRHTGKHAEGLPQRPAAAKPSSPADTKAQKIAQLKAEQAAAVQKQDYEQAAVLRDQIKELEGASENESK